MDSMSGLIILFYILTLVSYVLSSGSVHLDEFTFEKVISKFPAAIVKFDVAYPYGEKHEIYSKLAQDTSKNNDLLVARVGVKDYGDKENEALSKKYNVEKEDFPVLKLFVEGKKEPIDYPSDLDFTVENIKHFIKQNTNVYIGLPGCLEAYDKLAKEFLKQSEDSKKNSLTEAEKLLENITNDDQNSAKAYITIMKRISEQGNGFISKETKRLKNILNEKVSDKKKQSLQERLNILKSFDTQEKDEL